MSIEGASLEQISFGARFFGGAATGALVGASGLLVACGSSSAQIADPVAASGPRRGWHLRVGLTGGSGLDIIDPHMDLTYSYTARLQSLYDPLVQLNGQAEVDFVLAKSIAPAEEPASEWIMRLRPGVTFHYGKEFTSADVLCNFQRISSNKFSGTHGLGPIDLANTKALDARGPGIDAEAFPQLRRAADRLLYMAPEVFNAAKPVGTGPFVYQSPRAVAAFFTRNPDYWITGLP